MRYDEFRNQLQDALQTVGLFWGGAGRASETIDVAGMNRRWEYHVWGTAPESTEPFHVSAKIGFEWSPVDAARAFTCEEDLLTELLGRRVRPPRTQPWRMRVDLELHATLPYGSTTPIPEPRVLTPWTSSVGERLDKLLTDFQERKGKIVAIMGGREEPRIETQCREPGGLSLTGISVSAFQMARIPRDWDDPDRRKVEKVNSEELSRIARHFRQAFDEWTKSVVELGNWIRYSPPPPDTKRLEPWFEDEEDDNEPGTIH
jgi:hypothetical protein